MKQETVASHIIACASELVAQCKSPSDFGKLFKWVDDRRATYVNYPGLQTAIDTAESMIQRQLEKWNMGAVDAGYMTKSDFGNAILDASRIGATKAAVADKWKRQR